MSDLYVKIALVSVGLLIVLLNFVDISSIVSKLLFRNKPQQVVKQQEGFLEIVSLWYQLKNKCEQFKLNVASEKLDEVFPLLNGVLEDEKLS
jgi:hypothetical protein